MAILLSYQSILNAFTKLLSEKFNIDVFTKNEEGVFENECFYVTLVPFTSVASTKDINLKSIAISIKYFANSRFKIYDISNKLESLFSRSLKVNNRVLNVSNIEPNILNDEIGDMLDFLVYIKFFDDNYIENFSDKEEVYENMKNIEIKR